METIYSFTFLKIKLSLQKLIRQRSYLLLKYLLNNLLNGLKIFPKTDNYSIQNQPAIIHDKNHIYLPYYFESLACYLNQPAKPLCAVPEPLPRFNGSPWIYGSPWHSVNDSLLRKSPCREFFFSNHSSPPPPCVPGNLINDTEADSSPRPSSAY